MLSKTKKDRKNAQLKQFLLKSGSISRSEAVDHADLDIRTASSYLERLYRQGFCRKESSLTGEKGRPGIIYKTNLENMFFAGVFISQSMSVDFVLCSLAGDIFSMKSWKVSPQQSKLTVFNSILGMIKDMENDYPNKVLSGIGIAVSRWLQPPLATYDLYSGLANFLENEFDVQVHRTLNINALAYDAANMNKQKDLCLFHAGNVIELGIVQNGRNIQNFHEHEYALAHLSVNKNGPMCYCGKKGCLENYVTNAALNEKLASIKPRATLGDSDIKINKLKGDIIDYLTQACEYLDQTYKPEELFLMLNEDIAESVAVECKKEKINCKVSYLNSKDYSVVRGAALMAAFMTVKQYY